MLPKVYGERIATEVSGPGGGPLRVETYVDQFELARWIALKLHNGVEAQTRLEGKADDITG